MSKRWNFEMQDGKLMVCHGNHDKGQPCEYEPATVQDIDSFRNCIAELEIELHTRTLQWEGVKDMLATDDVEIAALRAQIAELQATRPMCVGYVNDEDCWFIKRREFAFAEMELCRECRDEYKHPIYTDPQEVK